MVRDTLANGNIWPAVPRWRCRLGDGVDGGPARPYKRRFTKTDVKRNGQYKISQESRTTKHAAHYRQQGATHPLA
jgi:hypothetical protein